MRHLIALVALATAFISTPAFPEWKTYGSRTDNLTELTRPLYLHANGRLTYDGSTNETHRSYSRITYTCEEGAFGYAFAIDGGTTHRGAPALSTVGAPGLLRGVFDGPNRPVNKVEKFKFIGSVVENETSLTWLMAVHAHASLAASSGLFEKIKSGEVTSIRIEFPTESGGLVFEYDTDNFPADACEGE